MTHPLPWPYSDWDQRPALRAPWQRGCDLYEAYGRFLERMQSGTICEDDGGWADRYKTPANCYNFGTFQDSGSYDSHFGYTTEQECETHRLREFEKLKRAAGVDSRSQAAHHERKRRAELHAVWIADVFSLLRKRGPRTVSQIKNLLGPPPLYKDQRSLYGLFNLWRKQGKLVNRGLDNGKLLWGIPDDPT